MAIADALGLDNLYNVEARPQMLHDMVASASKLQLSFAASRYMGDCKSVDDMLTSKVDGALENALKPLYKDMLDEGIMGEYFVPVVISEYHRLLINMSDWSDK